MESIDGHMFCYPSHQVQTIQNGKFEIEMIIEGKKYKKLLKVTKKAFLNLCQAPTKKFQDRELVERPHRVCL